VQFKGEKWSFEKAETAALVREREFEYYD